jgi:hypothetical protein
MIDVVKFTWRNKHGYWIPVSWITALTSTDDAQIRSQATIGRPGMTDLRILDRGTVPEEIRTSGRTRRLLSHVVLYDKGADDYSAKEMIEAMAGVD